MLFSALISSYVKIHWEESDMWECVCVCVYVFVCMYFIYIVNKYIYLGKHGRGLLFILWEIGQISLRR